MKSLMFAVLMMVVSSTFALDSFWRMDVWPNRDGMIPITPIETEASKPRHPEWENDETKKAACLVYQDKKPLSTDAWTTCELSFKAEGTGKVSMICGGGWAKEIAQRGWVYIRNIKVNGELYKNGDFKTTWTDKKNNNRKIPTNFWFNPKGKYIEDLEGAPAVLCNHDSKLTFALDVTEGTTYVISCEMKAAPAPEK